MSPHRKPRPIGILPDDVDGRRTMRAFTLAGALSVAGIIAIYTSVQSGLVLGVFSETLSGAAALPVIELVMRGCINLAGTAVIGLGVIALAPERRRGIRLFMSVVVIALASSFMRAWLQAATGIYSLDTTDHTLAWITEILSSTSLAVFAIVVGLLASEMWARARSLDQHRLAMQERSVRLLRDLQDEELRVRHELAETIHGSVQNTFVVMEATLRHLADNPGPDHAAQLRAVAAQLAALREGELRSMSAELYPVDLDRGMDAAVRTILARLPAWVVVDDGATESLAAVAPRLIPEARVLGIRVVEEAGSNAHKHGAAPRIGIGATEADGILSVTVENDGEPLRAAPTLSGLARLRRRAEALDGDIAIARGRERGTVITVRLPVGAASPAHRDTAAVRNA